MSETYAFDQHHLYIPDEFHHLVRNAINRDLRVPADIILNDMNVDERNWRMAAASFFKVVVGQMLALNRAINKGKVYICFVASTQAEEEQIHQFRAQAIQLNKDDFCIAVWIADMNAASLQVKRALLSDNLQEYWNFEPQHSSLLAGRPDFSDLTENMDYLRLLLELDVSDDLKDRLDFSQILMLFWLINHEAGHILHGHFAIISPQQSTIAMFEETASEKTDSDWALTLRTLEMDADAFAAVATLRYLSALNAKGGAWGLAPSSSYDEQFFLFLLVASSMLSLSAIEKDFGSVQSKRSHPPFYIRMRMMANTAWNNQMLPLARTHEDCGDFFIKCEMAMYHVQGTSLDQNVILQAHFKQPFTIHETPMLQRYAELYPMLVANKRYDGSLADPQY
ncbi:MULTISPECIES: hypothetical protein [Pacificibacter]|uniref:hypothetical protein n=1 Tax=Pacificibacter TaxID=1042323 RepID=UPI001C09193B|nr:MULTISPECIES: hypothetical protein [Pacificibacter]MBU2936187.1 hypothetical protein [Pacificibacter marinus]MDO6616820.1 hypothetical protein [Pacificibacter sp. 1_MG-2023]